jgi:hypothetical protein
VNKLFYPFVVFIILVSISCKKGCTDPLAYNYNANKTIDKGNCKFYDLVYLDSIKITRVNSQNSLGNNWDAGDSLDFDNDNSNPDISLEIVTPNDYHDFSVNMYTNINPFNPDIIFDFNNDFASDMWASNGYKIYVYDFEMNFTTQLIDSVFIMPFNSDGSSRSDRFQKEVVLEYFNEGIGLIAYFSWD